jgi:hypothetical protein
MLPHSEAQSGPATQPCCVCGTYFKGRRFFRYVEPKRIDAKVSGAETEDSAGNSAMPADSECSLDFGCSSDSDAGVHGLVHSLSHDGDLHGKDGATTQRDNDAASSFIDSQATVIVSQPQPAIASNRKRSAAALRPRVVCRCCRLKPRDAPPLSEDLVGRHSSWGNVSPFYFDLDSAGATLSHAVPALQSLPPEIALSAGHAAHKAGRPPNVSSRIMSCALQQSMHNAATARRSLGGARSSFKSFLIRRITFATWCALTRGDWASAESLARTLQPARMAIADVLWKTGLEVLRRNPDKDSQRRRFAQMCIGFTQGPLNSAVLNQHVVDTVLCSASPAAALAELRRFTVGSSISASPVLHYAIACAALADAAAAATDDEEFEGDRVTEAHQTAHDAATWLLRVAPTAAQSHVTMWHVLNTCGRLREAAAVVESALASDSPLHMHPSLLHIAISYPGISAAVAQSSAIYLMELDPCHPASAVYMAAAVADGRIQLPAAAHALAAFLDTPTPLHAQTWEVVSLSLGKLMWGWKEQELREWLGWRFVWWPRLHLSNVQRQISSAKSPEEQLIIACKALLALLLQAPSCSFYSEFIRSCSGWAAATWLQQAELQCREKKTSPSSSQELPAVSFSTSSEESMGRAHVASSSGAATASSPSSASVSVQ